MADTKKDPRPMTDNFRPTVVDLLDHMAAVFCDKYCKWPEQYRGDDGEDENALYNEHCNMCPLNDLGL